MKRIHILFLFITIMIFSNCNNANKADNSSDEVTVEFLKSEFDSGNEFFLLDVRTAPEFFAGRLSFARDLIPYDSLNLKLENLPQKKDATIYLFCRSGRRSGIATQYLRSLGYSNAFNVKGGIIAWTNAGFETVSGN